DALERGDAPGGLVVEARVRDREAALEGLGGGGVVTRVDPEHLHALVRVVRVDRREVPGLGAARRAGGVPEVEHDDVAAPVREVELLAGVGRPDELDGLAALPRVPRGPRAVAGL